MTVRLANIVFDCDDVLTVARFWSTTLRRPLDPGAGEYFTTIGVKDDTGDTGPRLYFAKVPEKKAVKNRVHVDLVADDREAEVARLVELGATRVEEKDMHGFSWVVMTDPEGNEFCIAQA